METGSACPCISSGLHHRLLFSVYFWLHWVFVAAHRLFPSSSLVAVSGGYSSRSAQAFHCNGFSCCGAKALGCSGSVVVVHKLNCPVACGIFPDQGSNLCPLQLAGGFLTTLPRGTSWDSSSDVQGGNVFEARGSECSLRGRLVGTQGCWGMGPGSCECGSTITENITWEWESKLRKESRLCLRFSHWPWLMIWSYQLLGRQQCMQ